MNFKGTLMAALAFLIVLGVFYWDYSRKQKNQEREVEEGRVVQMKAEDIDALVLKNEKGEVNLRKSPGDAWNIVEPIEYPADNEALTNLLAALAGANKRTPFDLSGGQTLEDYGLTSPTIVLEVQASEAGDMAKVAIGEEGPGFGEFYAHVSADNDQVFLVNSSLKYALDKSLFDLRDKDILPAPKDSVSTLTLVRPLIGDVVRAEKSGNDWSLLEPVREAADATAIANLLQDVDTRTIQEFIDTSGTLNLSTYGLDPPKLEMTVWGADLEGEQTLYVGNQVPEETRYYARRADRDQVFIIPREVFDAMMKPVNDLRSREVFPHIKTAFDVDRIEIRSENGVLALAKNESENWIFEDNPDVKADNLRVDDLAAAYTGMRVAEYLVEDPATSDTLLYGFDAPTLTATLASKDGPSESVVIGLVDEEQIAIYAQRGGSDTILRLEWTAPDKWIKSLDDLRLRKLADIPADEVAEIVAVQAVDNDTRRTRFVREDNAWRGAAGEADELKRVSDLDVTSFINALTNLRYKERYPPDSEDRELSLAPEDIATTLTLRRSDNSPLVNLSFTTPQFDVRFARESDGVSYSIDEGDFNVFSLSLKRLTDAVAATETE